MMADINGSGSNGDEDGRTSWYHTTTSNKYYA